MLGQYKFELHPSADKTYWKVGENNLDQGNFSWNPGLKSLAVATAFWPYADREDEGTLSRRFREIGMTSAMTNHAEGYVRHIGWDRHVS